MQVDFRIMEGNALRRLKDLPDESVHCVVTSPPYWQLRDYGVKGQLGLERTPALYVRKLVRIFREVRRVLDNDGTLWLNLGDTYLGGRCGGRGTYGITSGRNHDAARAVREAVGGEAHKRAPGLKPKDLVGIPWRVALALQADGWWLRAENIWHKPCAMPESVRDRPSRDHEHLFLLSKSYRYFYDAEAVKEPATGGAKPRGQGVNPKASRAGDGVRANSSWSSSVRHVVETRNKRTVWTVPQEPISEDHTATFPRGLVRPCVLAGCMVGGVVLDPFAGLGTAGAVALDLGRNFLGIELKAQYAAQARTNCLRALERRGQLRPEDAVPGKVGQLGLFVSKAAS